MKAFDWVLLSFGIAWCLFNFIKIWALLDDRRVKYHGAKINVGYDVILVPLVAFLIVAYRVGG
jgi:hypothetical protein